MIITTSQSVESRSIEKYLGVVSAALVMVLPGGAKAAQRGWQTTVEDAIEILSQQAAALDADAVIAVCFNCVGMHMCATGTAVKFRT